MEALQEQQRQAEELKLAEEEKRRLQLERRKKEIEEEKKLIEELKQEQEEVIKLISRGGSILKIICRNKSYSVRHDTYNHYSDS